MKIQMLVELCYKEPLKSAMMQNTNLPIHCRLTLWCFYDPFIFLVQCKCLQSFKTARLFVKTIFILE